MVVSALKKLPKKDSDFVLKHVWFVGSFTDGWAFTLRQEDLKRGEYLVFLSDELLAQSEGQIIYTILHELGHVLLGHKNSIGRVQTKAEVRRQEKEADEFAEKYI